MEVCLGEAVFWCRESLLSWQVVVSVPVSQHRVWCGVVAEVRKRVIMLGPTVVSIEISVSKHGDS